MKNQNRWLWASLAASLIMTVAVIYTPFLSGAFGFTHISATEFFTAVGLAILIIPIMELTKLIQRKLGK